MLVLRRDVGESLLIGDSEVTLLEIRGNGAKLGIEAEAAIAVDRKEVRCLQDYHVRQPQPVLPDMSPRVAAIQEEIAKGLGFLEGDFDELLINDHDEHPRWAFYLERIDATKVIFTELAKMVAGMETRS